MCTAMLCSVDSYGWYVCYICSSSYQRVGSVMVYLSVDVYDIYIYVAIICTTSCGGGLHAMWCCVDSYEMYALYV